MKEDFTHTNKYSRKQINEMIRLLKKLTNYRYEVACLVADGFTNPQIAKIMGKQVRSISMQLHFIYRKLGLTCEYLSPRVVLAYLIWEQRRRKELRKYAKRAQEKKKNEQLEGVEE